MYFYFKGDLGDILEPLISWEMYGFNQKVIKQATSEMHQLSDIKNDGKMITIFPISNMAAFYENLYPRFSNFKENDPKILSDEDAEKIHAKLLLENEEYKYEQSLIPSEQDIVNAQILLTMSMIQENLANQKGETE